MSATLARIQTSRRRHHPLLNARFIAMAPNTRWPSPDGSLCGVGEFRAPDAVLSGPAGGVLGAMAVAKQAGFSKAIGFDMYPPISCRCRRNRPRRRWISNQRRYYQPTRSEVITIAAGGGSILRRCKLCVGPESLAQTLVLNAMDKAARPP